VNPSVKSALALTAALLLASANFTFIIARQADSNLLVRGMAISIAMGIVLGVVPFVAHRRKIDGRGMLDVVLIAGLLASALFLLYFEQLKGLYQQGAFHSTRAAGWVAGTLLVLSYAYSRQARAERNKH
jgi:hypothetical protein